MGRTRDVSKILTSNTSILSLASASSIYQTIEKTGLVEITPLTISVTGGSGSISATGTVSFTSASAISLNNVFSSTYENYRVLFKGSLATGSQNLNLRLRADGSNNTTSNYFYYGVAGGGITVTSFGSGFQSEVLLGTTSTVDPDFFVLDFMNPQLSSNSTVLVGNYVYSGNGTIRNLYAAQSQLISFDGFSIYPASSTISGKITVYGYNK
jgi:hypothetical protein